MPFLPSSSCGTFVSPSGHFVEHVSRNSLPELGGAWVRRWRRNGGQLTHGYEGRERECGGLRAEAGCLVPASANRATRRQRRNQ
ncbi:hypothetical protein BRADI_4g05245v3 [Brachypodium distachyon]|uniref:Uncharacterized protein n=1 Tax=Brachypodium distachyon TaxID=15368 RepID=A0A0Q3HDW0_BRADI|nr:hypothetical protein BRADI_4g05245v3 [Brachypodium distachyon]